MRTRRVDLAAVWDLIWQPPKSFFIDKSVKMSETRESRFGSSLRFDMAASQIFFYRQIDQNE